MKDYTRPAQTTSLGKKEDTKLEQVIDKPGKLKKPSKKDNLLNKEIPGVGGEIVNDILIPSFKKAAYDIGLSILKAIFPDISSKTKDVSTGSSSLVRDYTAFSRPSGANRVTRDAGYYFDDVWVETKAEADVIISSIWDLMKQWKVVSYADVYDMAGVNDADIPYTANNYGWSNFSELRGLDKKGNSRDGYTVMLPKAYPINR